MVSSGVALRVSPAMWTVTGPDGSAGSRAAGVGVGVGVGVGEGVGLGAGVGDGVGEEGAGAGVGSECGIFESAYVSDCVLVGLIAPCRQPVIERALLRERGSQLGAISVIAFTIQKIQ